jgi:hypothetical protein
MRIPTWNPIEVMIVASSILSGISGVFSEKESSQLVQEFLPYWVLLVWYTSLALGGVGILYGLFKYNYYIAAMSYFIVSPISLAYGITIVSKGGAPLAYSAVITVAFGIAGLLRGYQLYRLFNDALKEAKQ